MGSGLDSAEGYAVVSHRPPAQGPTDGHGDEEDRVGRGTEVHRVVAGLVDRLRRRDHDVTHVGVADDAELLASEGWDGQGTSFGTRARQRAHAVRGHGDGASVTRIGYHLRGGAIGGLAVEGGDGARLADRLARAVGGTEVHDSSSATPVSRRCVC